MNDEFVHDPYTALALAVIYHAVLDLESSNPARVAEAHAWLQFEGMNWCQMLGISEEELESWAASGFPLPPNAHRNWRYG
ncbi:hypothetical protein ADN00_01270 [Ornatilinea apprima]|uniref:Uncharacterized protein n=1 Tax=Ornatilinea apprima TaxID=1134406 RepID=A0A0P6XWA9_9CHLR|nr:hypothetical protein [Ornatilinea apprima]KPL80847.1 hypothetical protein ADN00_01270 [Ornatilinea apprima]